MIAGEARGRRILSGRKIVRSASIGLLALTLSWLALTVTLASVSRATRPNLALTWMPFDARAMVEAAEQAATSPSASPSDLRQAQAVTQYALQRDPTVAAGWRTLGMIGSRRDSPRAPDLFRLANRFSRRDVPTQLWLIQDRAAAKDITGALYHYDVALRTSSSSRSLLFPMLALALQDKAMVRRLGSLLSKNPSWGRQFIVHLSQRPSSAENIAGMLETMTENGARPESVLLINLIKSLIDEGEASAAWRVYRLIENSDATELLRNGGFDASNSVPPFDWFLASESALLSEQGSPNAEARSALVIGAEHGGGGVAARQLLRLPQGAYQLVSSFGSMPGEEALDLSWIVQCVNSPHGVLLDYAFPPLAADPTRHSASFRVPADCTFQWLELRAQTEYLPDKRGAWVDSIEVRRIG